MSFPVRQPQLPKLCSYQTTKNLEYARRLVHDLESADQTAPVKRQKIQTDLTAYKATIRRLNETLHIAQQSAPKDLWVDYLEDNDDYGGESDSGEESEMGKSQQQPTTKVEEEDDDYERLNRPKSQGVRSATPQPPTPVASTAPASTLRRTAAGQKTEAEKRQALFGKAGTIGAVTGEESAEAHLDEQRKQQEDITEDLLKMAKMLKESSMSFGKTLEDEKDYLDEASKGLDRNSQGMEVAGRRIEHLRKKESVSFYWSIIYLASIMALVGFVLIFRWR